MKAKMYSGKSNSYLHDHIIDGFASSHDGIQNLKKSGLIKDEEYTQLLEKNIDRLINRIKEFRLAERVASVFFAVLFFYLQITDEDLEMRRARRVRVRKRNEVESVVPLKRNVS